MKIFACGIATETNTFMSVPTDLTDFQVLRGKDVREGRIEYPTLDLSAIWVPQAQARGHELIFGLMAWAQPSGITIQAAYEGLRDELLRDLQCAMPVDVVLLNLHGAMVAQGYLDCEEDMIRRVRKIVGRQVVIGAEFDLHCHLSWSKIAAADVVVTYKEYPHVDVHERARELFDLAIATRSGDIKPTMALFDCRMVGLYPTSQQPLRGVVDDMLQAEKRRGLLSLSFIHGFQFADVPHMGAKMLVVTDNDQALAEDVAKEFGLRIYGLRRRIGFDSLSLPMEEALRKAMASSRVPVVIADQSDTTGAGAPGDATYVLRWLLDNGAKSVATAIFYDPEVVRIAKRAGPGARLSVRLGGKLGPSSGDPVDLEVTVLSMFDRYVHSFPQTRGEPWLFQAGDIVALRCGSIDIVVSSERCQCFSPTVFSDLGIDVGGKHLLIPKSIQHFYGAFAPIAGEVIYMAAPGATAPDPRQLPYQLLNTSKLYPWVENPLASQSVEKLEHYGKR